MIAADLWVVLKALARFFLRAPSQGVFRLGRFNPTAEDCRAAAQRSLTILYVSASPSSVIVDIDREKSICSEVLTGLLTVLAAITIAAVHLFSNRARDISTAIAKPLQLLHQIHSGHIGDYVAFLTFGMACFGLLCAYCFR